MPRSDPIGIMEPQLTATGIVTSILLVTNIHCPSCVSYATDVLSPFYDVIHKVDISIIDHTIRIQHIGDVADQLARELVGAAFEVQHVTVIDAGGKLLREFEMQHAETTLPNNFFETLFMSKAQRKHIKNCNACQGQKKQKTAMKTTWADILRLGRMKQRSTSIGVGREILRSRSLKSDAQITGSPTTSPQTTEAKNNMYEAVFSVEGMTCASCVSAITNELEQYDYIQSVNVNLVANNAKVVFDTSLTQADDIKELIEDIGYGAEIEALRSLEQDLTTTDMFKASLSIDGMTCGSCIGTVSQALQELPFLKSADVDLLSNSATLVFQDRHNLDAILEKISDTGYDANVVNVESLQSIPDMRQSEERSIQIQILGMYCPNCPPNIVTAISEAFPQAVTVTKEPTLTDPRMTVLYRPSVPKLTVRSIIEVINSVDPACSASVYHAPTLEERSRTIQHRERNRILRHLIVSLLVAVPSFIIGVVYMSLVPADNRTRQWFEEPIWAGNAMRIDWALFIMTTPAMFYGASLFHTRALKEIWTLWRPRSKVPILRRFYRFGSMNLLISAGTSVAYFASLAVLIMDATSSGQEQEKGRSSTTYFDTVTFLTFFILIGRFLEAYSKAKTGDAVSMLADLRPSTAMLVEFGVSDAEKGDSTIMKQISVDLLEVGDIISIAHGASPPTDGVIAQEGTFLFDESSLTGESRPARKAPNDKIFTGTVNISDPVRMTVTEIGGKSMLDQIVNVVREGQARRAPIERLADALTGYFTPVITLLAVSTWIIWLALGESGALPGGWLDVSRGSWAYWSVEFAIAVFVVACPCGIGLAAPTALFVGGGLAAKNGILVQGGGEAFQEASKLDAIVFDKTGTLTEGRMRVADVESMDSQKTLEKQSALAIAKALEETSTHPIAKAIVKHCDQERSDGSDLTLKTLSIKEIPGQGMSGRFEVKTGSECKTYEAVIGNERLFNTNAFKTTSRTTDEKIEMRSKTKISNVFIASTLSRFQSLGNTTAILAIRPEAPTDEDSTAYTHTTIFAITDPLRKEAPQILASLRSQGLDVHMCTGDNLRTAQSIASQLSIPTSNIRAGVLPQDKAAYIQELQTSSPTRKIIAFVGDGTNDTPALTVSDVSIALSHPEGGGSDIALTSSSFVLLNSDLTSILTLVKLSKRVFLRVKLNFMWAAIYNVCLVPVAAGVFFPVGATWGENAHGGFRLSPVWASVAMAGSSVSVVLSSLALRLPEVEAGKLAKWFNK